MRLILAPEECLRAVGARDAADMHMRRAADRIQPTRPPPAANASPPRVRIGPGGYAARQLRRALAEYQARSDSA